MAWTPTSDRGITAIIQNVQEYGVPVSDCVNELQFAVVEERDA